VIKDLDAYVCLFEDCDNEEELYSHSEQWLKHMRQHSLRWHCNAKSHKMKIFDKQADYEEHLKVTHKATYTDAQLRLLSDRNARAMEPMFASCPLCGAGTVEGCLEDHIVGHLRFLALKSLPRIEDEDEGDSEAEGDSLGTNKLPSRDTIKNDEDRNVRLTFEDDDAYLRLLQTLTEGSKQLFDLPPIVGGDDYPPTWPADQSLRLVETSLLVGVSSTDLRLFEWGFVPNILPPYAGHESDPILQSFLQKAEKKDFDDTQVSLPNPRVDNDNDGQAPLSWAAESGEEAVMGLLIENEADVDAEGGIGLTALQAAAQGLHPTVVEKHANDDPPPNKRLKYADGYKHTAQIRRTGACLPCQMKTNKHKCIPGPDPTGACQACYKRANAISPVICRRARFQDIKVIRLGPSRDFANTLRWLKDTEPSQDPQKAVWKRLTNIPIKGPQQTEYMELQLSQGHSSDTLNLRVREFDPVESDKTSYPWFDNGVSHVYDCPHYAIADRDHAANQVRQFIDSNLEQYINQLLPNASDPSAAFVRMVFQTALDRVHQSSLIDWTLRFWVAGRFIEDPWSIQGRETLGMELDPLPTSPFSQRIPVTPIMDFQIDNIVIFDFLVPMLDRIRKGMRLKIMPIKKEDWFEIHLVTFILLHHVDLTMKHDIEFALSHNLSKRFSNRSLIEQITFGANSLLCFYQQEKGYFPLSAPEWSDVLRSYSWDESQMTYLLTTRRLIQQMQVPLLPGDDFFWTSQIYDSTWQPVLSCDADATSLPSEKARALIEPEWPSSVLRQDPVPASQSRTVLSCDADATSLPSGEKATALTQPEWPSSVLWQDAGLSLMEIL